MRKAIVALALLGAFGFVGAALAQGRGPGGGGWGRNGRYCRLWDSKTVETLSGTVLAVEKCQPMKRARSSSSRPRSRRETRC